MLSLGSGGKTLDAPEDISEATFEQQPKENLNSRKVSCGHKRIAKGGGTIPCSQNTRRYDEKLRYGLPWEDFGHPSK